MVELKGKKFLVTGGAGFIGSHICEEIVRQGKELVCLDSLVAGKKQNLHEWWDPKLCTFVKRDIVPYKNSPISFKGFMRFFEDVDVVFHNAASKCTVSRERPWTDLRTNAWGTYSVAEAACQAGVEKFIHASTGSVLQEGSALLGPISYYGVTKLAGEMYLRAIAEYNPDFRYTILRYFHVYGPRQDSSYRGGVIPIFIRQALNRESLTIFDDGYQLRHFTHVKDVVRANFMAANGERTDGKIYHVASPEAFTIKEVAEYINDFCGSTAGMKFSRARLGDINHFAIDRHSEIKIRYTPLSKGLPDTINWYERQTQCKEATAHG